MILKIESYEEAFAEYVETMWDLESVNEPNTYDIMKDNVILVLGIKYNIPKQWLKKYIISETEKYSEFKELLDNDVPVSYNQTYK